MAASSTGWFIRKEEGLAATRHVDAAGYIKQKPGSPDFMPITICLVEDHPGMRESFAAMLGNVNGFNCVGTYATGEEAVKQIPLVRPDVVLVDINLPGMTGIECVARLKGELPALQILMLTMYERSDLIFNSLRAGASGYLLKNTPSAELVRAIKSVNADGAPMSMQIARKVVNYFQQIQHPRSDLEKLTRREQEVLALVAQGCQDKEVADRLSVTLSTVRAHLHMVFEKLRVQTRTEAVVKFLGCEPATARERQARATDCDRK